MDEQENTEGRIAVKTLQSSEQGIDHPRDSSLRDLRQVFRSLSSKKDIVSTDITTIKIPREKKSTKLYLDDTSPIEGLYSPGILDKTIKSIESNNLAYYRSLNRSSIRSPSSRTMNKYISNLATHNLTISKLGRADRIPNYLKLANKIKISTLSEINKINKFNTFFSKSYIVEQSEYSKKQDLYNKSLLGSINNLGRMVDRKLETIKINTSISDLHKAGWRDIRDFNIKSFVAKKYGEAVTYLINKGVGAASKTIKAGRDRAARGESSDGTLGKFKNTFSDLSDSIKEATSEIITDINENLKTEKIQGHLSGVDGTVSAFGGGEYAKSIRNDIKAIRNLLDEKFSGKSTKSRSPSTGTGDPTEGIVGENISKKANDFFNKISGKTHEVFSSKNAMKFKETAKNITSNLFDNIQSLNKEEALDKLKESFDKNKNKLKGINRDDFLKFATKKLNSLKNINKSTLTNLIDEYSENISLDEVKMGTKETIGSLVDKSGIRKGKDTIIEQLNKALDKTKDVSPDSLNKVFEDLDVSGLTDKGREKLDQIKEQSKEQLESKYTLTKDYLKDVNLNDVQDEVTKFFISKISELRNLSKEDLEKFVNDNLSKVNGLDKKQVAQLTKNISKDIYENITTENVREKLENNFNKLKTSKKISETFSKVREGFSNWRDRRKENLQEALESSDPMMVNRAKAIIKTQEFFKGGKDNILKGASKVRNLKMFKGKQDLDTLRDTFEQSGVDLDEILSRLSSKEVAELIKNIGYKGISEKEVSSYRESRGIKFIRKGNTNKVKDDLRNKLMDLEEENLATSAFKFGRDKSIGLGVEAVGRTKEALRLGKSALPFTRSFNDPLEKAKRKKRIESRTDTKERLIEGFENIGDFANEKSADFGHYLGKRLTGDSTKRKRKESKDKNKRAIFDEIRQGLIKDIKEALGEDGENIPEEVIGKYISTKQLRDINKQEDQREPILNKLIDKIRRRKINLGLFGWDLGTGGKAARGALKVAATPLREVAGFGSHLNRLRKENKVGRQDRRGTEIRSEILDILHNTNIKSLQDMTDEDLNEFVDDRRIASLSTVGVGGSIRNTVQWNRRKNYIEKVIKDIVVAKSKETEENNQNKEDFDKLIDRTDAKNILGGVKSKSLVENLKSDEDDKKMARELRIEIINLIQGADPSIDEEIINQALGEITDNDDGYHRDQLNVVRNKSTFTTLEGRKRRYIRRVIKKVAEINKVKFDEHGASDLGKLLNKSQSVKLKPGLIGDMQLASGVEKRSKLRNKLIGEGKSEEEINIIMSQDRNDTLDSINKGINNLGKFFKRKKSLTDRDGDGDDDESWFDKKKKDKSGDDKDKDEDKEEEDKSRSLLSKLGKFLGPIATIFSGVASTLGAVASGALSLISGAAGAIAKIASLLGIRKLGLGIIGKKLANLVTRLKLGGIGKSGKLGRLLGSLGKGSLSAVKWGGRLIGRNKKLALMGGAILGSSYLATRALKLLYLLHQI